MINIVVADITSIEADVYVNAANTELRGGGGVDGAIHAAAGPKLLEECQKIGRICPGEAVITAGYLTKAKYVIHTAGPIWKNGKCDEENILKNCYENSLQICEENKLKHVAFSAISTGIYGFPKELATQIAIKTVLNKKGSYPHKVTFVCFNEELSQIYHRILINTRK